MSVASKNPFALLDSADNSRPSSPAPAPKAAPAPAPPAANRGQQKSRGGPASRGGKYYSRGGKPAAPKDGAANAADEPAVEGRKSEGGRGRGGRGRGRGAPSARGRQFDRHSATGRTDSQKKVHQGWGGDEGNTELKAEQAAATDAAAEGAATPGNEWDAPADSADWSLPAASTDAAAEGAEKPEGRPRKEREPEEEDNTLTLDQYLAQQKEKDLGIPKLETRKANEGAESWNDVVPLSKNEEEEAYFVGKTKSASKPKAKKEEKVFIEIDARFERPDRGGRGRGGRGGEKRGRGGPRGGRGRSNNGAAPAPNVDDQSAFPSLS